MCINVVVVLPTIERFLLLYSLRFGSIVILLWTISRSIFCVIFFATAILEVLIQNRHYQSSTFSAWLVNTKYEASENIMLFLFYSYMTLFACEAILLVFTAFLGYGIYFEASNLLKYYLLCRFFTWLIEILFTVILCLMDKLLIGYYLTILLFVVLEFYSIIVVYSYYVNIAESEKEIESKEGIPCTS